MTNPRFSHVYLMGRPGVQGVPEALQATHQFLENFGCTVTTETVTATLMPKASAISDVEALPNNVDVIIVVGGDGSLLNAAHIAVQHNLPVLGIHRGRLGFLTDIPPDKIDSIGDVLKGHYIEEHRYFIHAQFTDHDGCKHHKIALNDVVLLPGDVAHMIEYDTFVNDQLVYSQRADGLIIATPTGSTAYSLSGGGPILHPDLDAVVLVPMFPHTLSSRPIVLEGDSRIRVHINDTTETSPYLSCDGHNKIALQLDSNIIVNKDPSKLRLIHPANYDYFSILREKLGWERRARRT